VNSVVSIWVGAQVFPDYVGHVRESKKMRDNRHHNVVTLLHYNVVTLKVE